MSRTRDYRSYLRSVGRKPIPKNIRTKREPGHLEIIVDPQTGEERLYRFGEAA
jgi:hypothetical protein